MQIQTNLYYFLKGFETLRPNNFTFTGLKAMYNFFNSLDQIIEFDVIAICCDFTEYYTNADPLAQINEEYGTDFKTLEDLMNRTIVIESDVSIIIQNF